MTKTRQQQDKERTRQDEDKDKDRTKTGQRQENNKTKTEKRQDKTKTRQDKDKGRERKPIIILPSRAARPGLTQFRSTKTRPIQISNFENCAHWPLKFTNHTIARSELCGG